MATKVVVDPITRIEGHLRIEVRADAGRIQEAWACVTQFRGLEIVMQGRDPRDAWAFAQRICGVCTTVHAIASVRAVEDALGIRVPANAELIRNLVHGMQTVQDHVMHFYHLHALDWVDVVSALSADPAEASALARAISPWPDNSETWFGEVQQRVKRFVESGQLGIFANGYWGHPAYRLPPAANLMALAHYLQALDWQRDVIRLHTVFGGKNPHPNFLVGGMASAIDLSDTGTINAARLADVADMIARARRFVEQVYWPDLVAIAGFYKDWAAIGSGPRHYLSAGDWCDVDWRDKDSAYLPAGVIVDGNLAEVLPYDQQKVKEYVTHSWYEYEGGDQVGLHPFAGETRPKYQGPPTPWTELQGEPKYSWSKAPRYDERPMEVGPLARMIVAYARGHGDVKPLVDEVLGTLGVGAEALHSTLGRTAARGMETLLIARRLQHWYDLLIGRIRGGDVATFTKERWEPASWPAKAQGYGDLEAPRGTLGHWVQIEDGRVARYQCVVPSTWLASPRGPDGSPGIYETALASNHPLANPEQPLEILRTVHSFDPCMACGVHVLDASGRPLVAVRAQ
jgi:Ni,Fe-hydrogenase I large subunit